MNKIGSYLNFHAQALSLRSRRNEVLASNIANAATPNFKARDLDFDAEIRHHIGVGPLRTVLPDGVLNQLRVRERDRLRVQQLLEVEDAEVLQIVRGENRVLGVSEARGCAPGRNTLGEISPGETSTWV